MSQKNLIKGGRSLLTLQRSLILLLQLFLVVSFSTLNAQNDCTSTLGDCGTQERCLADVPQVCKWNTGFENSESRVIAFDITGNWVLGEIDIVVKAGQIDCQIDQIIGPECLDNCQVTLLVEGLNNAAIDGRTCNSTVLGFTDLTIGTRVRRFNYLGNGSGPNGTTRFYYCVNNNVGTNGTTCSSGNGQCESAISHISLLPLKCGEAPCVDIAYTLTPTHPGCGETNGSVSIGGSLPTNRTIAYSSGGSFNTNSNTAVAGTSVDPLAPGTYTFRVTDTDTGCSTDKMVVINTPPASPDFTLTPTDPDCDESTGKVSIGGSLPAMNTIAYSMGENFDINNNQDATGLTMISGLMIGKYTFRVTNTENTCFTDKTVEIEAGPGAPSYTLTPTHPDCDETNGSVSIGGSLPANRTIAYSSGGSFDINSNTSVPGTSVDPLAPGTYTFRVTNTDDDCFTDMMVTINQSPVEPAFSLVPTQPDCGETNGSVSINGSLPTNRTIAYSSGGSFDINSNTSVPGTSVDPLAPGAYTFRVTDTDNSCFTDEMVTINNPPVSPDYALTPTDPACAESTGKVTISGLPAMNTVSYSMGDTYLLGDNTSVGTDVSNNTMVALMVGEYTFRVTNTANDCFTDKKVEIKAGPGTPSYTLTPTHPDCDETNGSVSIGGSLPANRTIAYSSGGSFDINSNISVAGTSVDPLAPGTYTFRVTNTDDDCFTDMMVTINQPPTNPSFTLVPTHPDCGETKGSVEINGDLPTMRMITYSYEGGDPVDVTLLDEVPNLMPGSYVFTVVDVATTCSTDMPVTINEPPVSPDYTLTPTDPACAETTGKVTISGLPAMNTVSYSMGDTYLPGDNTSVGSNVANNTMVTGLMIGEYTFRVIDESNDCVTDKKVEIKAGPGTPSYTLTPTHPGCGQTTGSVSISGSLPANRTIAYSSGGSFDVDDNTSVGGSSVNSLAPGTYTFRVTNTDDECFTDMMVTINQPPVSPSFSLAPTHPGCDETNGKVTINGSLPTNRTIAYSSGGSFDENNKTNVGGTMVNPLAPGTYTFRVTDEDNDCFTDEMVTINQPPANPSFTLTPTDPACAETTGKVTISGLPAMNTVSYSMGDTYLPGDNTSLGTNVANNTMVPGLMIGEYTFRVTNTAGDNGCYTDMKVEIKAGPGTPNYTLTPTHPGCGETMGSVNIGGSLPANRTIAYSSGGSFDINSNSSIASTSVDPLAPGTYTFRVTNTDDDCFTDMMVTINQPPVIPDFSLAPTHPGCDETTGKVSITGSLPANRTIVYSPGGSFDKDNKTNVGGTMVNPLAPGTYTFRVTDEDNDCFTDEMVTINQPPANPSFTLTPTDPACAETTGKVTISGLPAMNTVSYSMGDTYLPGDNTSLGTNVANNTMVPGLMIGEYTFRVTNTAGDNGCYTDMKVEIKAGPGTPNYKLTPTHPGCGETTGSVSIGGSLPANRTIAYSSGGSFDINSNSSLAGTSVDPLAPGTYTFRVTNTDDNCFTDMMVTINQPPVIPDFKLEAKEVACDAKTAGILFGAVDDGALPKNYTLHYSEGGSFVGPGVEVTNGQTMITGLKLKTEYTFLLKNTDNTCEKELSITTNDVPPNPAFEASKEDPGCGEFNGKLIVTKDDNFDGFTIKYSSGSTFNEGNNMELSVGAGATMGMVGNMIPSEYTFRVSNNTTGCYTDQSITINTPPPTPELMVDVTQPDCTTPTGKVTVTSSFPASYTLAYSEGSSFNTEDNTPVVGTMATSLAPDKQYTFLLTNTAEGNGCSKAVTVGINKVPSPPDFVLEAKEVPCEATTAGVLLKAPIDGSLPENYSIFYHKGNSFVEPGTEVAEGLPMIVGLDLETTYTFRLVNDDNGCLSEKQVTTKAPPMPPVLSLSVTQPTCEEQSGKVTITSSIPQDYTLAYSEGEVYNPNNSTPVVGSMVTGLYPNKKYTFVMIYEGEGDNCNSEEKIATINEVPEGCYVYTFTDPCVCLPNGKFSETVTVTGPSGADLVIDPTDSHPPGLANLMFVEDGNTGVYSVTFEHEPGIGFSFYVIDRNNGNERIIDVNNQVILIENVCERPELSEPQINTVCNTDNPIDLANLIAITGGPGNLEVFVSFENRAPEKVNVFDPKDKPEGSYKVEWVYTSTEGTSPSAGTDENPGQPGGCVVSYNTTFELIDCKEVPALPNSLRYLFILVIIGISGMQIMRKNHS